jgi:ABC-type antimicrobial peptide transport system permease subunit
LKEIPNEKVALRGGLTNWKRTLKAADITVISTLRQAAVLTLSGAVLGMVFALLVGRVLRSMIHEVNSSDPLILSAAGVFVIAMALAACCVPARKATKTDPMIALRAD